MEIGLHPLSNLRPNIRLIWEEMFGDIREGVPWCMVFVDVIVLVTKTGSELNVMLNT